VPTAETGAVPGAGYDIVLAPVDLKLRAAIALRQQAGCPLMLVDQLGRIAGCVEMRKFVAGCRGGDLT
jgi:glycine betaine/proline transport system ATP-binding protein